MKDKLTTAFLIAPVLVLMLVLCLGSFGADAQQPTPPRVGWLAGGSPPAFQHITEAFLHAEGWCVGDFDWTDGSGKYKGISGKNKLRYKVFGRRTSADTTQGTPGAVEGYSIWEGTWNLP